MVSVQDVLAGNRLALARLLTEIENETSDGRRALNEIFVKTGRAHLIGVTGSPGTGKSTLVNQLAHYYRKPQDGQKPQSVAVIAVDPSSPFSGGAVLGDRVRMRDLAGDPGVFIRSMASRGSLGGLAAATSGMVQAFDAAGYDIILIETVGAGQAEVDIARLAHTTLVIEAPGMGDDIQAIKAGILEIADILVINKADRSGVENTERALKGMLSLAHPVERVFHHHGHIEETAPFQAEPSPDQEIWVAPIQRTIAPEGTGITELVDQINQHRVYLKNSGNWQQREMARLQNELNNLIQIKLTNQWRRGLSPQGYQNILEQLVQRSISPREAANLLINGVREK
ncbi:MAG: methylmalonyl Co-A mutase-associated GTPase MeaB [Chloroflexota bacterium]